MRCPSYLLKRPLDIFAALWLLGIACPLWLIVVAAIRITSPGTVFYRARRVGCDGNTFNMYKFRSMEVGADAVGPAITVEGDPRVTLVGRVLRNSKLDELPQLLNVLKGDMSLVGPRPEDPRYVDLSNDEQLEILRLKPGITGPSQLRYRYEERLLAGCDLEATYQTKLLPQKMKLDVSYVRNCSFRRDFALLAATALRLARV